MGRTLRNAGLLALLVTSGFMAPAFAHEIRPALLEITETQPGWYEVTWKVPMLGDQILHLEPVFPAMLEQVGPPSDRLIPGALVQHRSLRSDGGSLIGETITIAGLSTLQIDVLLRLTLADGTSHTAIIKPGSPTFVVPARATKVEVAKSYSLMGFEHILDGADHLLFLAALLLLVSGFKKLLKTITAFTIAHSVTLALATLGLVNVPSAPTEAIISLSIVFLGAEIIRRQSGEKVLTAQYPWVVAFIFGLFHGLGFAGALSEIGVPQHEVPLSLLMFNVGVEGGQILFVTAVLTILALIKRLRLPQRLLETGAGRILPAYAIGGIASFWTIQRVLQ